MGSESMTPPWMLRHQTRSSSLPYEGVFLGVENYRSHGRSRLDNQDQHRDGPRTAVRLGHRDGFDSTVRKNSMTLDGICPSIQIRTLF